MANTPNVNPANMGNVATGYFQLACPCDFLCIAASASQIGAGDCLLTTAVGVEYTTENSWLETMTPQIPKPAFELGIASLREVDQFYENPIHIPSLLDAIGGAMGTVAPLIGFMPGIGPGLSMALGTGSQVIQGVKRALYGNADNETQTQGENRQVQQAQKRAKRRAELEIIASNGAIAQAQRRRRVR